MQRSASASASRRSEPRCGGGRDLDFVAPADGETSANPMCASCHQRMDPMGFSLENYNAIGEWRTHDGKFEIDSAGVFPDGRSFKGPDGFEARTC